MVKRISAPTLAAFTAIIVAIASIAFSFGVAKNRIDSVKNDIEELRNLHKLVRILDSRTTAISVKLDYLDDTIREIKRDLKELNAKLGEFIVK